MKTQNLSKKPPPADDCCLTWTAVPRRRGKIEFLPSLVYITTAQFMSTQQKDMVAFLLERGANPNRAGATWATPLAWAQKNGHSSVANVLLASGATNS